MNQNDMTMTVTRSIALSGEEEGGLICIKGDHIGQMIRLPGDEPVLFGRDKNQCTYVLSDTQVSRKHCEITYVVSMNKYRVIDYSKNGTFIGTTQKMEPEKEYYLEPGTELYIGNKRNLYKLR